MPFFEHTFEITSKDVDGNEVRGAKGEALRTFGPVLQVLVSPTPQAINAMQDGGQPIPTPVAGLGLIDTGATSTCIDESVCQGLGIRPTGIQKMGHAGGTSERACYPVEIHFPGVTLPNIIVPLAMSVDLRFGTEKKYVLLLGRDLLSGLRFVYNGPNDRIEIQM